MKKLIKKGLCVLLAVAMIACGIIPAFAEDQTPVVLVPGVLNVPVYDESGKQILMPDIANQIDVEGTIDALKDVLHLQDTGAYDQAIDKLISVAKGLFDDARCDENGESVVKSHYAFPNGSIAQDPDSAHYSDESAIARLLGKKIGNRNVYIFTYDWRMDVVGIVDNSLAPLIERVKKETGSDKVTICAASMGSAITNTYLSKYGNRDDVKKVIFISGAGQGVQFVQDIYLTNPVCVNRKAMAPYFKIVLGMGGALGISAVSRYICDIAQKLMDSQYEKLWTEFVEQDLLCWPSMWELAGHTDQMEALLKSTKNEVFQNKVMTYYGYQDNLKNTLDSLKEKGVEICYTSNYNLTGVPATPRAHIVNTDYLIDTYHTSNGATVADLGKTLGDNYTQKNDDGHNHLSEDGVIDASTCYSPETTWFIKNLLHVSFQDGAPQTKFICWLVLTKDVTIESDPETYPQFMEFATEKDENGDEINVLKPVKKVVIENPEEKGGANGEYISSAVTVYSYYQITALGWALIIAIVVLLIVLIAKKRKNKQHIEGVLTKEEIKALPKSERKAAKKQNKARIKEWKKEQKARAKARKAELKAMPRAERKAAIKADKAQAKAARKQAKRDAKAAKKQAKIDKKAAKAAKKAAKGK
ncbi:MAG: hypothetical protein IJJ41_03250 [Clostridia bacterium]|nr:hypothetical protein [Clostridia bacterium]